MQTMTRTDHVDAQTRQIQLAREHALLARTAARAFIDYGSDVAKAPTKGNVGDEVAELIEAFCKSKAAEAGLEAVRLETLAAKIEGDLGFGA